MKLARLLCGCAVALTAIGTVAPETCLAERPVSEKSTLKKPRALQVVDVALQDGGVLRGVFVDEQGKPVTKSKVWVRQKNNLIAATETNAKGQFEVPGLRGGVYQVSTVRGVANIRTWAPRTAPPSARRSILLVANREKGVVRGQHAEEYVEEYVECEECPERGVTLVDPYNPFVQAGVASAIVGAYFFPRKKKCCPATP